VFLKIKKKIREKTRTKGDSSVPVRVRKKELREEKTEGYEDRWA
jgi:hypothetical protein